MGIESVGMSELIFNCIQRCAMDIRRGLYENIILSGGTTMFPGLPTRISKDVNEL